MIHLEVGTPVNRRGRTGLYRIVSLDRNAGLAEVVPEGEAWVLIPRVVEVRELTPAEEPGR